jgi:hypothetical protein
MDPKLISLAVSYNRKASGTVWRLSELPWPFNATPPDSTQFVSLVATFQMSHGLKGDGKLGPATLAAMRELLAEGSTPTDDQTVDEQQVTPKVTPARIGVSNKIIVGGKHILLPEELILAGVTASNYLEDDEAHFEAKKRSKSVTNIVIHESVTRDAPTTVRVLKKNGYGVHLMLAPDGHVSCHNDLLLEQPIHGNQMNGCSVGLEIVNPYTAKLLKPPFTHTIPATWWTWVPKGAPKQYTLPTPSQLRVIGVLVPWLCGTVLPDCPITYPTADLNKKSPRIDGWDDKKKPGAGVVAHRDFSTHADGRYLLEHLMGTVD